MRCIRHRSFRIPPSADRRSGTLACIRESRFIKFIKHRNAFRHAKCARTDALTRLRYIFYGFRRRAKTKMQRVLYASYRPLYVEEASLVRANDRNCLTTKWLTCYSSRDYREAEISKKPLTQKSAISRTRASSLPLLLSALITFSAHRQSRTVIFERTISQDFGQSRSID